MQEKFEVPQGIRYAKATDFSRGKASKYLRQVHDDNEDLLVIKHSSPYAVVISFQRYMRLFAVLENEFSSEVADDKRN